MTPTPSSAKLFRRVTMKPAQICIALLAACTAKTANAQSAASPETTAAPSPATTTSPSTSTPTPSAAADSAAAASPDVPLAPNSPTRKQSLVPHPIEQEPEGGIRFTADPIGDAAILSVALGFSAVAELIISTGEIHAQQIDSSFQSSQLLGIDRGAISQKIDSNAGPLST
ncbi:MAG: hypothetical protein ABI461_10980, partial [Polyangiaceae bacterium]